MTLYQVVRGFAYFVAKIGYRAEFYGLENEPTEGGVIVFSNHSSLVDPFFTAPAVKRPLHFMAKSDLQKSRFMKWLFNKCNVVAINRGESDIAALRKVCDVVASGGCVGIYPQGTRIECENPDPETALAGMGLMASRAKATLLPVTICYGKGNKKPKLFSKVKVYVGKPITFEEYSNINERPNSHEIAKYAFSKLCEDFGKYNHD